MGEGAGQSTIVCCLVRADAHAAAHSIRNAIVIAQNSDKSVCGEGGMGRRNALRGKRVRRRAGKQLASE